MVDTLPMEGRWPEKHLTPGPLEGLNWRWLDLWTQENPAPPYDGGDWDYWYGERQKIHARILVASALPQFRVFDWSESDVLATRTLIRGHVCGRCNDPGCTLSC